MSRYRRRKYGIALLCTIAFLSVSGCQSSGNSGSSRSPGVLVPVADGKESYVNEFADIDISHKEDGYICIAQTAKDSIMKAQVTGPDMITYTYDLTPEGSYETFPLSAGDGTYYIQVYENIMDDQYAMVASASLDLTLADEFGPFLYPNQYVNFTKDTQAVTLASELASEAEDDLAVVSAVYHYVTDNVTYDMEKATTVANGYLPDVDETLNTGKGICFDYAALMTAMLRSQGIPTKLQIGYSGDLHHAWISTYLESSGWVDNIIQFDGTSWSLMDPTFASGEDDKASLKNYIGDGSNYIVKYSR